MPYKCAVKSCSSKSSVIAGARLHSFPKDPALKGKWCLLTSIHPKSAQFARICSLHFKKTDFHRKSRFLKANAIPSRHLNKTKECSESVQKEHSYSVKEATPTSVNVVTDEPSSFVDNLVSPTPMPDGDHVYCKTIDACIPFLQCREETIGQQSLPDDNVDPSPDSAELKEAKQRIALLERHCQELAGKLAKEKKKNSTLLRDHLSPYFTPAQVSAFGRKEGWKRISKWNKEDLAKSISARLLGRRAYNYIRQKMKIPLLSVTRMRKEVKKYDLQPGQTTFHILKERTKDWSVMEKLAVIAYDDTCVKKCYEYDSSEDLVYPPKSKMNSILIRGLCHDWVYTVSYSFDSCIKEEKLLEVVKEAELSGFLVVATTSDMGTENTGMNAKLGVTDMKPYFRNPADPSRKVYSFYDHSHALKNLRLHLCQDGFVLPSKRVIAKRKHLQMLLDANHGAGDLKIAPYLKEIHLNAEYQDAQRVSYATNVFHQDVVAGLKTIAAKESNSSKTEFEEVALFIEQTWK